MALERFRVRFSQWFTHAGASTNAFSDTLYGLSKYYTFWAFKVFYEQFAWKVMYNSPLVVNNSIYLHNIDEAQPSFEVDRKINKTSTHVSHRICIAYNNRLLRSVQSIVWDNSTVACNTLV